MKITRQSFTLIELLIVIAIIAILIGVLVPSMSRSLSGNRLASDVEVLRAKIEETRLLAGSTQTNDEKACETPLNCSEDPGTDRVGYYGIYIPPSDIINGDPLTQFYAIVRLSDPFTYYRQAGQGYCSGGQAVDDAINNNTNSPCLIERVNLTRGVTYNDVGTYNLEHKLIVFRVPTQQVAEIYCPRKCGDPITNVYKLTKAPLFTQDRDLVDSVYFKLKYNDKTATIKIEPYTGKLKVVYN